MSYWSMTIEGHVIQEDILCGRACLTVGHTKEGHVLRDNMSYWRILLVEGQVLQKVMFDSGACLIGGHVQL